MNQFCIVGNLTKDPEIKTLSDGNKVCNVIVACDRDYKDKDGNKLVDYLKLSLWNKNAELINEHSKKGSLIKLEGHAVMKKSDSKDNDFQILGLVVDKYKNITNEVDSEKTTEKEEISK